MNSSSPCCQSAGTSGADRGDSQEERLSDEMLCGSLLLALSSLSPLSSSSDDERAQVPEVDDDWCEEGGGCGSFGCPDDQPRCNMPAHTSSDEAPLTWTPT